MINERRLYQKNKAGYILVLLFVAATALHSAFTLNAMETDQKIGTFIMTTIFILLLGFLIAVKVRVYSMGFSYAAIILGVIQVIRTFFIESMLEGPKILQVNLILVASGLFCVAGGIVSLISSRLRQQSQESGEAYA